MAGSRLNIKLQQVLGASQHDLPHPKTENVISGFPHFSIS